MKLATSHRVDYETATHRVLAYLVSRNRLELLKANAIASKIWPEHQMTSQGAGAAASRILKRLQKDGLVRWNSTSDGSDWGYQITSAGTKWLNEK